MSKDYAEVIVIRQGVEVEIPVKEVVVGDIMLLMSGQSIEVDGILVNGFGLTVSEKELTGFENAIRKSLDSNPFILAGSHILDGSGMLLVCAVGSLSNIARIRKTLPELKFEKSPLQDSMNSLVLFLGKVGLAFALFLFVILFAYLLVDNLSPNEFVERFLSHFILCLTLLIISVPEGLPIVLSVAVSKATQDLRFLNCFIRSSQACELLGSIDTILIDKKGLLTKNQLEVNSSMFCECLNTAPEINRKLVAECISRSTIAQDSKKGNQIEVCLISLVKKWGLSVNEFRNPEKHIAQIPISEDDLKSSTFYVENGYMKIYSRGNDSVIIDRCIYFMTAEGDIKRLTSDKKEELKEKIREMAKDVLVQSVSISYKAIDLNDFYSEDSFSQSLNDSDRDMIYMGTVVMHDQIDNHAQTNIRRLRKASTQVILLTSDDKEIAEYIGQSSQVMNINRDSLSILSAEELKHYEKNSSNFETVLEKLEVIYGASFEDKKAIIQMLKNREKIVAITGETMNDSYIVKSSDIGVALRMSNILVKENSDMILLEDSFSSLEAGIRLGRNLHVSILKFIKFQMTLTFVTLIVVTSSTISIWDVPLSAIQILVITIAFDAIAAIALALEDGSSSKISPKVEFLDKKFMTLIGTQTVFQVACLMGLLWVMPFIIDIEAGWEREKFGDEETEHYTIFFACYSFMNLFNLLNARAVDCYQLSVFKNINRKFVVCWAAIYFMIITIIEVGGSLFHCAPSSSYMYVCANALGLATIVVELITKYMLRIKEKESDSEAVPLLK